MLKRWDVRFVVDAGILCSHEPNHSGLQDMVQLYEAGRKYDISAILLPMPGYINALPWKGFQRRTLLVNLYLTDGPSEVQKAALAKLMAAPADLSLVLRRPRGTDVANIVKQAFSLSLPRALPQAVMYLRFLRVPPLCYQSASDVLAHLQSLAGGPASMCSDKDLITAVSYAAGMSVILANNVKFHINHHDRIGYHPLSLHDCVHQLLTHQLLRRIIPPGSDWEAYLSVE